MPSHPLLLRLSREIVAINAKLPDLNDAMTSLRCAWLQATSYLYSQALDTAVSAWSAQSVSHGTVTDFLYIQAGTFTFEM